MLAVEKSVIILSACISQDKKRVSCDRKTSPCIFDNFPFSCAFEDITTGLILLNTLHGNVIVSVY